MPMPAAVDLLNAWDAGLSLGQHERSMLLLRTISDMPAPETAAMPLGTRDRRLLEFRTLFFGEDLIGVEECPDCGVMLEITVPVANLLEAPGPTEPGEVRHGDFAVRFRLPSGEDMGAAERCHTGEAARETLIDRCVVEATHSGRVVFASDLPEEIVSAIAAAIAASDPLAHIELSLLCDQCGANWISTLDVGAFLWREIDFWAMGTVRDISVLARAYGWTEADVLALSPQRRSRYLELVSDA